MRKMYNKWAQVGRDCEEGVNIERLRRERLQKTREAMRSHGLGAMVVFTGYNVRYITGTAGAPFPNERYAVLPLEGEPMLFELGGDLRWIRDFAAPWLAGRISYSIPFGHALQFGREPAAKMLKMFVGDIKKALEANGVSREKVGFDFLSHAVVGALEDAKINYVEGVTCMDDARYVKTKDELQCLAIAASIVDACFYTMEQMLKPGVREWEVWAEMNKTAIRLGAESIIGSFASGGRTNPYCRFTISDRILAPGDLVIADVVLPYMGYFADFVRTMLVGDKPTSEQKALYRECYDSLSKAMNACKAGVGTDKVAEALPYGTFEDFSLNIAHGVGLNIHERPFTTHMFSKDYPIELKPNCYMAIETYAAKPGGADGVRLEEDFVVTETGYKTFSRYPFDERML